MIKKMLVFVMAFIMSLVSMSGLATAVSKKYFTSQKDTPIATIKDDGYVPYTNRYDESIDLGFSNEFEPVTQVITVMTTPTGSTANGNYKKSVPLRDVIVRIDGIPMYTNYKGEIQVTLTREYVELQVSKDGYNPHIEIIEASGIEKIVYLKQPTDDIEIFSVMFQYGVKFFNLLTQPCYYLQNQGVNMGLLTVNSNIEYDLILFYINDELKRVGFEDGIIFTDDELDSYNANDKFSLKIVYEDIESKRVDLQLKVEKFDVDKLKTDLKGSIENDGNDEFGMNNDSSGVGDMGNIKIDRMKWREGLTELIMPSTYLSLTIPIIGNVTSLKMQFSINSYKGTISFIGGISVDLKEIGGNIADLLKAGNDKKKTYKDIKREKYDEVEKKLIQAQNEQEEIQSKIKELSKNSEKNKEQLKEANAELDKVKKLREEGRAWTKEDGYQAFKDESGKFISSVEGLTQKQQKIQDTYDTFVNEYRNAEKAANQSSNNNKKQIYELMKESLLNKKGIAEKKARIPELIKNGASGGKFNFDIDVSLLTTVEYSYRNRELVKLSVMAELELKPSYTYQFFLTTPFCVIPLFIKITGSFGLSASVVFLDDAKPIPISVAFKSIELAISLGLRVDGGVGIPNIATAGVYGKVKFKYKILPEQGWSFGWSAGVLLTLFGFEFELGYETDYIPLGKKNAFEDSAKLKLSKRAMATSSNISNNQVFDRMYNSSIPQLIQLPSNEQMMFWIEDDSNRDSYNRSVLKYAVCKNGIWSQAKPVLDNGRADHNYDIYATDDSVFIAVQKSKNIINANNTINDISKGCEIYALQYDIATDSFNTESQITSDDVYDSQPQFAVSSGRPTLVWQSNLDTDFMTFTGKTSIYSSSFDGSGWSSVSKHYHTQSIIYSYTASVESNALTLVVSEDDDGDFLTQGIKNTVVKGNDSFIFDKKAQNPKYMEINNCISLVYYNGKDLMLTNDYYNEQIIVNNISTQEYTISKSTKVPTIFYEGFDGVAERGYCAIYAKDGWTENISTVVEGNENSDISSLTGYYDNGIIYSTYNYCLIDEENPSYGQLVLCVAKKDLGYQIQTTAYSLKNIENNATISVMLNVENKGDFDINKMIVSVCGQSIILNLHKPLKVGESEFFEIEFTAIIGVEDYFTIRTDVFDSNDILVSTDECQLQAKYTNMQVDITRSIQNGKQEFIANIENISSIASGYKFTVYINGEIYKEYVGFLKSGEKMEYVITLDEVAQMDYIYFAIVADVPEFNVSDNSTGFYSLQTETTKNSTFHNAYYEYLQNNKFLGV